ncbi:MAG TPA: glycoside hydrolase family 99-like domain-containing protein [Myxococcota bacterium]
MKSAGACSAAPAADRAAPRLIALYLPQFHPIPENDRFWGAGFTEWTNVAAARPLYRGHEQPRLPGELGFYDLRVAETRAAQAALARAAGIEGFCYWHYWFGGQRLLERPFQEVLESGEPDFPFCLGWANDHWTGVWYGAPDCLLVEQTYPGLDDYRAHFEAILPALRDRRYLRVGDKPLFAVFRPMTLPDPKEFCALWRELAERAGLLGLHLVGFGHRRWDPTQWGFDASVQHGPRVPHRFRALGGLRARLLRLFGRPMVYPYRRYIRRALHSTGSPLDYPLVLPNWDNTPRSGTRGFVLHGSTPSLFREHLQRELARVAARPPEQRIVFIKSWNEWAEGNYLEPDRRFGRAYLDALREALDAWRECPPEPAAQRSGEAGDPLAR